MGVLREKIIAPTRAYIDKDPTPIPSLDYNIIYPITTYAAVHRTMEDDSGTLDQEIEAIYRLLSGKQPMIFGGTPGTLMTWSALSGEIGETELVAELNPDVAARSPLKAASEKAVSRELDAKADKGDFLLHESNARMHITDEERDRWNNMTPLEDFEDHIENESIHTTAEEKASWDAKANKADVDFHLKNGTNPHNVTAHQTGTYDRHEIDQMFDSLREAFFNYKNIFYDDKTKTAELVEYSDQNANPAYVLANNEELPTPTDTSLIHFALRPASDYATHETQMCNIYRWADSNHEVSGMGKWVEVGTVEMTSGDLVIRYPDTAMCVWIDGRFVILFTTVSAFPNGEGDFVWRPVVSEDGILTWEKSTELDPPDPVRIKGDPADPPVKGKDYFDGAPGVGVPSGGSASDVLTKVDGVDYNTKWTSLPTLVEELRDMALDDLPGNKLYNETGDNEDGAMTQKATTEKLDELRDDVDALEAELGIGNGNVGVRQELNDHIHDYNNPHQLKPETIGAVSLEDFTNHTTNFSNPHGVDKADVGLGNVTNTSDEDKPVSRLQQQALDALDKKIDDLSELFSNDLVTNIEWDPSDCKLTFTFRDESQLEVVLPILEVFESTYFDAEESCFVMTMPDNTKHKIPVDQLMSMYKGSDSKNIHIEVEHGIIKASIRAESITGEELVSNIRLNGSPETQTQLTDDISDKIATTKFVKDVVIDDLTSYEEKRPLSANMGRILNTYKVDVEDVLQILEDTPLLNVVDNLTTGSSYAALSANMGRELMLQKAPMVHTSPTSSKYGRATALLFGHVRTGTIDPLMDGIPFPGTDDGYYAPADHRHPVDASRAPIFFPDTVNGIAKLLGEPRAETPPADSNDDRIATTEWTQAWAKTVEDDVNAKTELRFQEAEKKLQEQANRNDEKLLEAQKDLEEAKAALQEAQSDIGQAKEDLGQAKEDLAQAQQDLVESKELIEQKSQELQDSLDSALEQSQQALESAQTSLQEQLDAKETELKQHITDKEAELQSAFEAADQRNASSFKEAQEALQKNFDAAKEDSQAALEAAKKALQQSLDDKTTEFEADLQGARDELAQAQEALESAQQQMQQDLATKEQELEQHITEKEEALQSAFDAANEKNASDFQDAKDALQQSLTDAKTESQAALDAAKKEMQQSFDEKTTEFEGQLAQKESDLEAALEAAQTEMQGQLDAAQEALEGKVTESQTAMQEQLDAKEQALEEKVAHAQEALESAQQQMQEQLEAKETELEKQVTDAQQQMQQQLEEAEQKLSDAQTGLQESNDQLKEQLKESLQMMANDEVLKIINMECLEKDLLPPIAVIPKDWLATEGGAEA